MYPIQPCVPEGGTSGTSAHFPIATFTMSSTTFGIVADEKMIATGTWCLDTAFTSARHSGALPRSGPLSYDGADATASLSWARTLIPRILSILAVSAVLRSRSTLLSLTDGSVGVSLSKASGA